VKNIDNNLQKNYGRSGKHTHGAEADAEMEKEIAEAEEEDGRFERASFIAADM